jgi:hypothetical protein
MSKQVMTQSDGLRVLEVSAAGHWVIDVAVGLLEQRFSEIQNLRANEPRVTAQVHAG